MVPSEPKSQAAVNAVCALATLNSDKILIIP